MSRSVYEEAALKCELERLFTEIIERGEIDDELLREIVALPKRNINGQSAESTSVAGREEAA